MKKHLLLAIVMLPFLGYVGYALTDWYLKKESPQTELMLMQPTEASCQLDKECQFYSGDFLLKIKQTPNAIIFEGNQRLKGLMVEIVKVSPPKTAQKIDEAGYQWQLPVSTNLPHHIQLHWVAQGYWGNYIGEIR